VDILEILQPLPYAEEYHVAAEDVCGVAGAEAMAL
jgi:hypothetical protein